MNTLPQHYIREFCLRICLGFDGVKNKKRLSNPLEEQKTGKNGFPTPWMSRKQEKWLSNPLDELKTEENGFPTPWKREDRRLNRIHNNNGQETI